MARPARREQPLTWNVIDFEANAVWILEKHRVVARRPFVVLRRMDDVGADRLQEGRRLVDLVVLANTEADMVQARSPLVEALALMPGAG